MWVIPVMFPPGRAKLAMSPLRTGSATAVKTTGIVLVALLGSQSRRRPPRDEDVDGEPDEFGGECGESLVAVPGQSGTRRRYAGPPDTLARGALVGTSHRTQWWWVR